MPLLGTAALLLSFDVAADSIAEHDHWHSFEHLPERLSIPGFLRGTRWTCVDGLPRYMVLYEVESLATLSSAAYLERLNAPTPWTSKMMLQYRNMNRGLCSVLSSTGFGQGGLALLLRFTPQHESAKALTAWLRDEILPGLPAQPGLGSAHLLEGAAAARMTNEQKIRGLDGSVDSALIITAHDLDVLNRLRQQMLGSSGLGCHGAEKVSNAIYQMHHTLSRAEIAT